MERKPEVKPVIAQCPLCRRRKVNVFCRDDYRLIPLKELFGNAFPGSCELRGIRDHF
jgi:hypothetical protein